MAKHLPVSANDFKQASFFISSVVTLRGTGSHDNDKYYTALAERLLAQAQRMETTNARRTPRTPR